MSDNNPKVLYEIPLNGKLDFLGIYIDEVLPNLDINDQIISIKKFLDDTESKTVSFLREGNTDCIMMCPEKLGKTSVVQWKIGNNLDESKCKINILRNHFKEMGMESEKISYDTNSCKKCGKTDNLKSCGACKKVKYCGITCQKSDWKEHKKVCNKSTE